MQVTVELNEADLLARMRNFEDHLVERKVVSDEKDWKKTAVAFANSAAVGIPAVLFIGVRNNGEIEMPQRDLDEVQKRFNTRMKTVYPRIPYVTKTISENGLKAVAIIIPGSILRPHFAGLAYIRRASVTEDGSEQQVRELIAQRNSKAATILEWKDKNVTVYIRSEDSEVPWANSTIVTDCNQFYVSVQEVPHQPATSFPLSRVEINFDNLKRRLQLEISDRSRNAWKMEMERHVRIILSQKMTRDGQELLKWLLIRGRVEVMEKIVPEISRESQDKQMQIAISAGIVRSEQEPGGLHRTFFVVNPECWDALKMALPQVLK